MHTHFFVTNEFWERRFAGREGFRAERHDESERGGFEHDFGSRRHCGHERGFGGRGPERGFGGRGGFGRGFGEGRGRMFDAGDIKLVILKLLSEQPSYGYQLIKTLEEQLAGGYTPSAGVIYPTLFHSLQPRIGLG